MTARAALLLSGGLLLPAAAAAVRAEAGWDLQGLSAGGDSLAVAQYGYGVGAGEGGAWCDLRIIDLMTGEAVYQAYSSDGSGQLGTTDVLGMMMIEHGVLLAQLGFDTGHIVSPALVSLGDGGYLFTVPGGLGSLPEGDWSLTLLNRTQSGAPLRGFPPVDPLLTATDPGGGTWSPAGCWDPAGEDPVWQWSPEELLLGEDGSVVVVLRGEWTGPEYPEGRIYAAGLYRD